LLNLEIDLLTYALNIRNENAVINAHEPCIILAIIKKQTVEAVAMSPFSFLH
jgi:hypothetical protein